MTEYPKDNDQGLREARTIGCGMAMVGCAVGFIGAFCAFWLALWAYSALTFPGA